MSTAAMADEDAASTSASPKLEESVEVEPEVKEEQDADEDAPNEPEENEFEESTAVKSGDRVTNPQYKGLKEITEILTNHKITRRGDECVHFLYGYAPIELKTNEL